MLAKITTFDMKTMEPIETNGEMHCNLMVPEKQEWLRKHLMWAVDNHYGIQIMNNVDSELETDIELQEAYEERQRAYRANNGIPNNRTGDRDRPVTKVQKVR